MLAEEGVTLIMRGAGDHIATFVRSHPEIVEAAPESWLVLGLERWLANDASGAGHWLDRMMADAEDAEHDDALCPRVACARLLRRMSAEPLAAAVGNARRVVMALMRSSTPEPLLPLLLAELGIAQAWLGELSDAEVDLTTAVTLSRARGLTGLTTAPCPHLALTLYMQGRESACIEIADDVLARLDGSAAAAPYVHARALLARELAMLCDVTWPEATAAGGASEASMPLHVGDPVGRFWARLRDARRMLMAGSVSGAEQLLEVPAAWFPLPEHLRVVLVLERGFLVISTSPRTTELPSPARGGGGGGPT